MRFSFDFLLFVFIFSRPPSVCIRRSRQEHNFIESVAIQKRKKKRVTVYHYAEFVVEIMKSVNNRNFNLLPSRRRRNDNVREFDRVVQGLCVFLWNFERKSISIRVIHRRILSETSKEFDRTFCDCDNDQWIDKLTSPFRQSSPSRSKPSENLPWSFNETRLLTQIS
jgi:hypothetical protein